MFNIELGGGRNPVKSRDPNRQDYINLDIIDFPTVDFKCDLRLGIPYRDHSVDNIYTCEFLEHLPLVEVQRLLRDCHRVLVPQGTLYITCPNFDGLVYFWNRGEHIPYITRGILGDGIDPHDYHRSLLTTTWIIDMLDEIGFGSITDISDERRKELNTEEEIQELKQRGVTIDEFLMMKIHVRAIK